MAPLSGNTLVVTGASGRVGRLLQGAWQQDAPPPGLRVLWCGRGAGMDIAWRGNAGIAALPKGCTILHLAGVTGGAGADLAQNTDLALAIGLAARLAEARRVLFASTVAVYGTGPDPFHEDDTPRPQTAYGRAKHAAEAALVGAASPVPVTILRIGNVVGADALSAAAERGSVTLDPISLTDGGDSGPVRSWIGPRSLARVLEALVLQPQLPGILNIASAPPLPMHTLLDAIGCDWRFGPANPAATPHAVLDVARLDGLIAQAAATADGLIAEWRSLTAGLS